jgi:hypothetical protein
VVVAKSKSFLHIGIYCKLTASDVSGALQDATKKTNVAVVSRKLVISMCTKGAW